ncbi:unnamed protein product [Cyprideis torosa]|uniref:Phosphatidylinositol 3,4,5-trisphosphate 3-phosphatase and dual-specificity protein phosphatase PTEN n=1 Tax=Cyprideis torosa TaxID=163714 RepID=A0A7R8W4H6_9CRUS|nr:unnamed protein product [Cyprideis torosa]CAG0880638.1 unnamed protein product [Cyprideis torosa]
MLLNSYSSSSFAPTMANHIKGIVSKKKKRYKEDGFDLDLAYIRENVIAMGFPASKLEGMFRNHIDDVVKFMEQKHAGHYKIYNLCSERDYDGTKFNCEIGNYPFEDHNPPNLGIIRPFCEDMADWLGRDERNVAAVHCKAGKGRTGVMICCYMLHTGLFSTAEKALDYYGKQRTHDKKGVTIPSQRRYVEYYSMLLRSKLQYKPVTCLLRAVELVPLPSISNLNSAQLTLYQLNQDIDGGDKTNNPSVTEVAVVKGSVEGNALRFNVGNPLPLRGDIKVEVTHVNKLMQKEKLLHCWVNTFFVTMCPFNSVPSMYIPQHSVDDSMLLCPQDTRSRHQRVRHQSGSTQRPVSGMPSPGVPSAPLLTTPPAQPQPVDSPSPGGPSPGGPWRMGGPNNSGGSSSSADSGKENYIPLTKASSVSGFPAPPEGGTVAVKSRRSEPRVTTTRTVTLTKKEIDKAAKDKAQRFDKDFKRRCMCSRVAMLPRESRGLGVGLPRQPPCRRDQRCRPVRIPLRRKVGTAVRRTLPLPLPPTPTHVPLSRNTLAQALVLVCLVPALPLCMSTPPPSSLLAKLTCTITISFAAPSAPWRWAAAGGARSRTCSTRERTRCNITITTTTCWLFPGRDTELAAEAITLPTQTQQGRPLSNGTAVGQALPLSSPKPCTPISSSGTSGDDPNR